MLDGQYTHHSAQSSPQISQLDLEFSGLLNRASSQGLKFGLLLAMLQQNYLERVNVSSGVVEPQAAALIEPSVYPKVPITASTQHWQQADTVSAILHSDGFKSAHLWLTMHPQPLSLFNDVTRIDEDVLANCDIYTQQRYSEGGPGKSEIQTDEVGIYDLLQDIGLDMQSAA